MGIQAQKFGHRIQNSVLKAFLGPKLLRTSGKAIRRAKKQFL